MQVSLKERDIVEGPFWKEPIEIKAVEDLGDFVEILGRFLYSKEYISTTIPKEDLSKITLKDATLDFSTKGTDAFLALEAKRIEFASEYDPLLAMNTSKIDPLPFQIEAVYGYILKLPRIRFLIADDPGAGKTIMAGLIIKELKLRGLVKRILIVVPGHLKDQWRRELEEKFQESFVVVDRNTMYSRFGENVWEEENQVITSMDFAKQEKILPSLQSVHWDLVIVDEAHKMSAYKYGKETQKTDRYKLGEVLSKTSEHLIFLTATPHRGDPENFRLLLDLLEPGFFATSELIEESLKERDNPLFIRRLKEDLRDFEGKPLFPNRYPMTIRFKLSDEEKILYNELSQYVISQYNKALETDRDENRNIAFALLILQRRMASSCYALLKSLERRKKRLEEVIKLFKNGTKCFVNEKIKDIEEIEDYEEEERIKEEERWETITLARNEQELQNELRILEKLISMAKKVMEEEKEVKLKELRKAIEVGFKKIREMGGNEKILIFTESRDTLDYLVEKIRSWGYKVNYIHGGMSLEDRIKAEGVFKQESQIMVATDAAGEGINLQFCHLMINYDIPWNPNKLEQRMGRIHRYGQQKDVYIFNLVAEETKEGMVLNRILSKIEEMRIAMGSDKVFDVIGELLDKDLYELIVEAVTNAKSMEDIIRELDIKMDKEYIEKVKDALGESLATRHIDYTRIKELAQRAKENRLAPEYLEEFFKKAFPLAGGKYKVEKNGFIAIESIPRELRKLAEAYNRGSIPKYYKKATFDKDMAFKNPDAEFISFGHILFDALIKWINEKYLEALRKGAVFEDPSGKYEGIIWFFEGEIRDGKGHTAGKRLFAVYDNGKELKEINPNILWDLKPVDEKVKESPSIRDIKEVENYIIKLLNKYRQELLQERERQAQVKQKYGIKSLEYLIADLDHEIIKLGEDKGKSNVGAIIKLKDERRRRYIAALNELKKEIELEKGLSLSPLVFLGAILVKPSLSSHMVSDEEIERIGMEVAMTYERSQGREPEDVSEENLGYDIRSKGRGEIRYIEVKARKDDGDIALTPNELLKAKRFKKEYWLYVVANAITNPTLYIINNPAENL
ncbi:MAG: helicase-related protein, partial [Aquificaceae bacterium]